ncbi:MAG: hypothetical protein OEN48_04305 [Betaproteobacteria bacterium]|nr:hypothetical protein [Betaproteobacteria bacterium]
MMGDESKLEIVMINGDEEMVMCSAVFITSIHHQFSSPVLVTRFPAGQWSRFFNGGEK